MVNKFAILAKIGLIASVCYLITALQPLHAQEEDRFSMDVQLISDQFWGFYPYFIGSYSLNNKLDFTFYGVMWSAGEGGAWGNWTEFGVGLSFEAAKGIYITPQIGLLGGSLLSKGADGVGILGDGIAPNLAITLKKKKTEGEATIWYYAPLRNEAPVGGTTLNYLHYLAYYGFKASEFFSFGAHYEKLINTGGSNITAPSTELEWLGPYIQFKNPKGGAFVRFTFGKDFYEGNESFYRLATGFSF
ncbi:DUF6733 family protein [Mongoliitalea lutea]|uniref:Uncharacterized protein n=1 Tax=Mongoliitalea lutea TaxID=849756 RepID=A0A8J3CXH3_9BACT|nr:DUF6733 family protein [Mongoliitalea lutea]GHB33526.1 hypothetical protein GCM10008106_13300 [Mongoliitalea lutea]